MITVTRTSRELTKVEEYLMTQATGIEVVKNLPDGTAIEVVAWCEFVDHKKDGEDVELLSILDSNKKAYSCQSATFKRAFMDIATLMGNEDFTIIKTSGQTKAGRPYVNCELDVTNLK